MDLRKCYDILDIEPGATDEEIKDAVRDLVKVWHPDRFDNEPRLQKKAQEKLKEINEAYDTIKTFEPIFSAVSVRSDKVSATERTSPEEPHAQEEKPEDLLDKLKQKGKKSLSEEDVEMVKQALFMMIDEKKKGR